MTLLIQVLCHETDHTPYIEAASETATETGFRDIELLCANSLAKRRPIPEKPVSVAASEAVSL